MTATASLEDYIKQFKQDYKKYLSSDTSSITSSIDTEDLLSDISSETSSIPARPVPKSSVKSISSLKKRNKKTKVNPPPYMKPLHSTPLKMIQEEDEFAESKYKLSEYLPGKDFDIDEYLPKARAAKNQKVKEILASLDVESENLSVISSVDTEALLQSSDEEEVEVGQYKKDRKILQKIEKKKNFPQIPQKTVQKPFAKGSKQGFLSIDTTSVLSLVPKKLSLEKSSMLVCKSKGNYSAAKPSQVFNSFKPAPSLHPLRVCTCIMSGSLYKHYSSCKPVNILSNTPQRPLIPHKPSKSLLESVITIQKAVKKYLLQKQSKKTSKPMNNNYLIQATSTLSSAYKQLEALRSLASEQSSEISLDGSDYDVNSIDTDSLLNSSFSSILSRH